MFGIFKKILSRFSPKNFMSRLVPQTVIYRKKTILEVATMLLLTINPFYGWIFFFYISEFNSKCECHLLECCAVGGKGRRLSAGCILPQQQCL